ncbi:hypothetical protein ACOME3_002927 [Neoechinorhynchus agilis]
MDTLRLPSLTEKHRHSVDEANSVTGTINIAIFGPSGVGKTTLINQFINGKSTQPYQPTVEDCHSVSFKIGEGDCRTVQFIDTAGLYDFPAMRKFNVTSANAFILVFEPTKLDTLHYCFNIIQEVYECKGFDEVQIVLIGNNWSQDGAQSVTTTHNSLIFKLSTNVIYYYISVTEKSMVDKLMNDLVRSIIYTQRQQNRRESYQWFTNLRKRSAQSVIGSPSTHRSIRSVRKRSVQSTTSIMNGNTTISESPNDKSMHDTKGKNISKPKKSDCAMM